ncbi:zinc finger CCCH domain-containing protein 19-like isoform X2 [Magnolia sinica]|uniref:zinc finger CCCH domain-containing protein 19-like isoform X2 n=1 Tax=Magnolia sinica TaxID=86752 RepID=UPI00265B4D4D|nr:zinc finger CCCH domain-containing protein 19-like isoform X2 [Magnolia sinica]
MHENCYADRAKWADKQWNDIHVQPAVDFDDKTSWEYLFKEYWLDLKRKLSLAPDELTRARNPLKGSGVLARNGESSDELYDANADIGSSSDSSSGHLEASTTKKGKKRSRSSASKEGSSIVKHEVGSERPSVPEGTEWASKELLEFVSHMKDGDKSILSQFDVQALLLEYIKRNNLRDPRKKSQIICDSRLESLFGKARVGHFEMLKLLESHFLIKENPLPLEDDGQGGMLDSEAIQMEAEGNSDSAKAVLDKRRKIRKRIDDRGPQANLDDYAAIDVHNINLIYLRRNLMEDLIDDVEKFQDMVVGSFVRIRISGTGQKQDMYRLVQVVGTGKAAEMYKTGKKTTDFTVEILNLNKTEVISIDIISNQEFTEEECKRLRQSIKCGLIPRLTVGEVQGKARALQAVRVNDWLETELLRLSHLRDRASEKGRKKEHRECVEKIQLLNTPEERSRRLQELPEVHADPNMDPGYESDEHEEELDDKKQDNYMRLRDSGLSRKGRDPISPGKVMASNDGWSAAWNPGRNVSPKGVSWDKADAATAAGERTNDSWNQGRDAHHTNSWEAATSLESAAWNSQPMTRSGQPSSAPESASTPLASVVVVSSTISETDKIWHYQDPSRKIQGPFSMAQLRKWSKTGYFPDNLRIWKVLEKQEDSILLTDALIGKFQKDSISQLTDKRQNGSAAPPAAVNSSLSWDSSKGSNAWSGQAPSHTPGLSFSGQSYQMPSHQGRDGQGGGNAGRWNSIQTHGNLNIATGINQPSTWGSSGQSSGEGLKVQPEMPSAVAHKFTAEGWGTNQGSRNDFSDPPTPTPKPSSGGWTVGQVADHTWSPTSVQPGSTWPTTPISGMNGPQQQPPAVATDSSIIVGGWDSNHSPASTLKPTETGGWISGQPSPNILPEGAEQGNRNGSLNLPAPTPKPSSAGGWAGSQGPTVSAVSVQPTSAGWSNARTPGDTGEQLSSSVVNEPFKVALAWDPPSPNLVKPSVDNIPEGQQTTLPDVSSSSTHMMVDFLSSEGNRQVPTQIMVTDQQHVVSHGVEPEKKSQTLVSTVAESAMLVDDQGPDPTTSATASSLPPAQASEVNWQALAPLASAEFLQSNMQNQVHFAFSESIQTPSTAAAILSQDGWGPSGWNVVANAAVNNSQPNPSVLLSGNPWNAGPVIESPIPMMNTGRVAGATENRNTLWMTAENSNQSWLPAQGNANTGFGTAPPQGNTNAGWGMGMAPPNANAGWGAAVHGNTNMGWDPSAGNSSMWVGNQQTPMGERFSGQSDRGFQGGESGQGGGRPLWMRQASGGGGGSSRQAPPRGGGQRVCKFHENGYCKKGSSCGYLHT